MKQPKKVRIHYYEDVETAKHLDKIPYHNKSIWIREATEAKMKKETKLRENPTK